MKISVVIPAKNEEANIENMVNLLERNFRANIHEIIVVNDCSTDKTKEILERIKKRNKKLKPVHRTGESGVGRAIKAGLLRISNKSTHVLMLDCDFTKNTKEIGKMIKESKKADGVFGSRYMKGGILVNYPLPKKIANRLFHYFLKVLLRFPYIDVTNNFKLFKVEVVNEMRPLLKSTGFSINAETGIYPFLLGYHSKEIPVRWIGREGDMGKSSFSVAKAGPGYIKVLEEVVAYKKKLMKNEQELERRHFDYLVRKTGETYYGNLRPIAKIRFQRKAKLVQDLLKGYKDPKVLEIGCGTGILSEFILKKNPSLNIKGIDISPEAIKVAREKMSKYKNVNFKVGSVTKSPYASESFDLVIGNSVLHHLDLKPALREIRRVLKTGGKIWFCEPNIINPQIFFEKNIPLFKTFFQDTPNEKAFSRWSLAKLLKDGGFNRVVSRPYEFLHPLIPGRFIKPATKTLIFLEKVPLLREFAGTLRIEGIK